MSRTPNRGGRLRLGRRNRLLAAVLAASGVVIGAAATPPATADPGEKLVDIQQRQQRVEARIGRLDDQQDHLLGRIGSLDTRRDRVDRRVRFLDDRLDVLRRRIGALEDRLADAQNRIALLEEELFDLLDRLDFRRGVYASRAADMYMAGPTAYVDGLLTSNSFDELVSKIEYHQSAAEADLGVIEEIEHLQAQTEDKRDLVEEERARIADAKLRLEADRDEIARLHAQQSAVLARRERVLGAKRAVLRRVETKKSAYERVVEQLERDAAQIRALLSGGASGPLPVGGGQLAWPAAGPVTSPYGYRTHPIFGDTRLHTGIDIGAPYGAPVVAADGGVVVYAGALSGYGNVIAVDHGGGLATTYNHLSAFYVSRGQSVSRGSRIGAVGCTGYCTGPHLHFEVRVNGNPVDPMPYLR